LLGVVVVVVLPDQVPFNVAQTAQTLFFHPLHQLVAVVVALLLEPLKTTVSRAVRVVAVLHQMGLVRLELRLRAMRARLELLLIPLVVAAAVVALMLLALLELPRVTAATV